MFVSAFPGSPPLRGKGWRLLIVHPRRVEGFQTGLAEGVTW